MGSMSKSKILIIGSTGYLGRYLVEASIRAGHPTFVLVRESTIASNPDKAGLVDAFKNSGVTLLFGDMNDHESLVSAIKHVDVVFSLMGHEPSKQLADQINIVSAIKEAGNVKRYFPSEYGLDVDRVQVLEPAKSTLAIKAQIRRATKEEGIPFTFVCSNFCATYFLSSLGQVEAACPSMEKVVIMGDGNKNVIFVSEHDIATYAIRAVDDPRTLNKILYVRPLANTYSTNKLVSLWEKRAIERLREFMYPKKKF